MPATAQLSQPVRVVDAVAFAVLAVGQILVSILAVTTIAADQMRFEDCGTLRPAGCAHDGVYYGTQVVTISVALAAAATLVAALLRSRRRALLFWIPLAATAVVALATLAGLALTRVAAGAL